MPEFSIHDLQVGGGMLALCPLPGRNGDYASDLNAITAWGPDLMLSMTTAEEMVESNAAQLGNDIRSCGGRWQHLPIPDFGAPGDAIRAQWPAVCGKTLKLLSGGGRVLVHCRGGCGRSGMVALRLMVEAGEAPKAALARLRAIRPCAVETAAQMRWAAETG